VYVSLYVYVREQSTKGGLYIYVCALYTARFMSIFNAARISPALITRVRWCFLFALAANRYLNGFVLCAERENGQVRIDRRRCPSQLVFACLLRVIAFVDALR
jgi:hypothetical protein